MSKKKICKYKVNQTLIVTKCKKNLLSFTISINLSRIECNTNVQYNIWLYFNTIKQKYWDLEIVLFKVGTETQSRISTSQRIAKSTTLYALSRGFFLRVKFLWGSAIYDTEKESSQLIIDHFHNAHFSESMKVWLMFLLLLLILLGMH